MLPLEVLERKPSRLLKVVPTEETTSRPTSPAQDAAFRNGDRSKILSHSVRLLEPASSSPTFTRSLASNRLSPSNAFFCSSVVHSSQVFLSSLGAAAGVSSHHPPLEFFLEFFLLLGFEARHSSEELPRFLLLGLEASLLFHACCPEFSISQQLRWSLIHELLSH